jgi:hypothetical protein
MHATNSQLQLLPIGAPVNVAHPSGSSSLSSNGAQVLFVPGPDGQSIQLQVLTTADGKLIAQQVVPPPACVSNSGPSVAPPPPPPPATPLPHAVFLRALFSFDAQTADDLPFRKGDRMLLTKPPHGDWWYARHLETQQDGYIPSNYVVIDDGKVQSQDCWFDISRRDADRLLLMPGNPRGTYLIRPSSDPRHFALSVRDQDETRGGIPFVKHYKIRTLDDGRGYYISPKATFPTFGSLIAHYESALHPTHTLLLRALLLHSTSAAFTTS